MNEQVEFSIRRAQTQDAAVIGSHRARMFQEMGLISAGMFNRLRSESERWTESALASGEYVGWLGSPSSAPGVIAAGAGVQIRRVPPHPRTENGIAKGRHAIVLNVFTEPEWRRRGFAALLMRTILDWARAENLYRLVLHASAEGRRLYEQLGFVATNEMRYNGEFSLGEPTR
jgi:GNAT superfamily N-acetyltransferase